MFNNVISHAKVRIYCLQNIKREDILYPKYCVTIPFLKEKSLYKSFLPARSAWYHYK